MASKTTAPPRSITGRVGQRREVIIPRKLFESLHMHEGDLVEFSETENGVLMKPKRWMNPDDVLTPAESALVKKAEREMHQGKYVTLAQLRHALDRPHSPRSRKTA